MLVPALHATLENAERALQVVHNRALRFAARAINQCQHLVLTRIAPALGLLVVLELHRTAVADEGLINLNGAAIVAEHVNRTKPHSLANAVRHKPRRLVRNLKHPVKLVGANALLAGRHQVDRLKPLVEWDMTGLENRAYLDRKLFPAVAALP